MEIRWKNIVALVLTIIVVVLVMKNPTLFQITAESIQGIGPGHSTEEKVNGLILFTLLGVMIVAIVRLLISTERDDHD